tara:strand:- start:9145 stop:9567 length:423 start_codon:yes stop_codon:yes gene_type:complete
MLKNIEVKEDKPLTNLEIANQKYYKYLVDCIVDGTEVTMQINSDREEFIWFLFKFDDKDNRTAYRCGSYNKCTIFNVINATRRITNFLISDGLQPKEITTVLDLLKLRWIEKYDICFGDYIYGLPHEFTKYQLPFPYTKY